MLIADTVHGSIPLTRFEKVVISTQLFNRLHNVLQNSTVYYTYPSTRTSRFSHSLGAMHVAAEIYYRSILNADEVTQLQFLEQLWAELLTIIDDSRFRASSLVSAEFNSRRELWSPFVTRDIDVVYQDFLPRLPGNPEHQRAYLVGLQAVRLAGLLHDVGHPPLSHIAEFALNEIVEELTERKLAGESLTSREKSFLAILRPQGPSGPPAAGTTPAEQAGDLHERIGLQLAEMLLSRAVHELRQQDPTNDLRSCLYLLSSHLASNVLSGRPGIGTALHSIVAGDFDADRLDYVTRDTSSCGISGEPFRYERLRNGLRLIMVPGPDGSPQPRFRPSVRALSDLERFYRLRQELYKYVVHHHRVVRTDGLLRLAIQKLTKDYLGSPLPDVAKVDDSLLPTGISRLWFTLHKSHLTSQQEAFETYIQWDDPWLMTTLRDAYFEAVKERADASAAGQRHEPNGLEILLAEIISDSRHYFSLYKGIDTFVCVDDAFIAGIPKDFDIGTVLTTAQRALAGVEPQLTILAEFQRAVQAGAPPSKQRHLHGFFLSQARKLNQLAKRSRNDQYIGFVFAAAERLKSFGRQHGIRDVRVFPKVLKRSIDDDFLLHDEGEQLFLKDVSRLVHDLEVNAAYFPPFFVYVLADQAPQEDVLRQLRTAFGEYLVAEFLRKDINT